MNNELLGRRRKTSTRNLSIGDVYYTTEDGEVAVRVLAQGPEYYLYGYDRAVNFKRHQLVWIGPPPRAKAGEFSVGEQFRSRASDEIYTVTAVGEKYSLAMRSTGDETMLLHEMAVEEVK